MLSADFVVLVSSKLCIVFFIFWNLITFLPIDLVESYIPTYACRFWSCWYWILLFIVSYISFIIAPLNHSWFWWSLDPVICLFLHISNHIDVIVVNFFKTETVELLTRLLSGTKILIIFRFFFLGFQANMKSHFSCSYLCSVSSCWRTSWKTHFCWCLLTNRTSPTPYQSASSQTDFACSLSATKLWVIWSEAGSLHLQYNPNM